MTKRKFKPCPACKAMNQANRKSCIACYTILTNKRNIQERRERITDEWAVNVTNNRNTSRIVSSAQILVQKLAVLGYTPILFLRGGRKKNSCWVPDVTSGIPLSEELRPYVEAMKQAYGCILNKQGPQASQTRTDPLTDLLTQPEVREDGITLNSSIVPKTELETQLLQVQAPAQLQTPAQFQAHQPQPQPLQAQLHVSAQAHVLSQAQLQAPTELQAAVQPQLQTLQTQFQALQAQFQAFQAQLQVQQPQAPPALQTPTPLQDPALLHVTTQAGAEVSLTPHSVRKLHPAPEKQNSAESDVQLELPWVDDYGAPLEDDLEDGQELPVAKVKQELEGAEITQDRRDPPAAEDKGEQVGSEGRKEPWAVLNSRLLSIEDRLAEIESKNSAEETTPTKRRRLCNP